MKTSHYIVSIQDSINGYREVQSGYVDVETDDDAESYFRNSRPFRDYFGNPRYQITMQKNPAILQWPGEPGP